jgi:hypothetical protein
VIEDSILLDYGYCVTDIPKECSVVKGIDSSHILTLADAGTMFPQHVRETGPITQKNRILGKEHFKCKGFYTQINFNIERLHHDLGKISGIPLFNFS